MRMSQDTDGGVVAPGGRQRDRQTETETWARGHETGARQQGLYTHPASSTPRSPNGDDEGRRTDRNKDVCSDIEEREYKETGEAEHEERREGEGDGEGDGDGGQRKRDRETGGVG